MFETFWQGKFSFLLNIAIEFPFYLPMAVCGGSSELENVSDDQQDPKIEIVKDREPDQKEVYVLFFACCNYYDAW